MDPASIIGTTAAALQFLKLITTIATGTWRAFGSAKNIPLDAQALQAATEQFRTVVNNLSNQLSSSKAVGTQVQLQEICADCLTKARQLQAATSALATKVTDEARLRSLWEALKRELGRSELERMATTLADHQSQLVNITVMCLWEDSQRKELSLKEIQTSLKQLHDKLPSFKAPTARGLSEGPAADSLSESNVYVGSIGWGSHELSATRSEIIDLLIDRDWNPEPLDPALKTAQPRTWQQLTLIKMSLDLGSSSRRHDDISQPYKSTFEWIWNQNPEVTDSTGSQRWSSFPAWLQADDESHTLYWVTGRPGSGKSTLMRFLEDHEKLRQHLACWRPQLPLHVWSFYAWNPGSDIEKSIDGLIESILYQAMDSMLHLLPVVAPRRWAYQTTLWGASYPKEWKAEDKKTYEEALYRLLAACRGRARLLILIDGLDEFDVPPKRLVEVIQRMSEQGSTKICVASRPWPQFRDHFRNSPSLAIHCLTKGDIETYVKGKFRVSAASEERPDEVLDLQRKVIEAARGVFQWVAIVVNFLVDRLEAGESQRDMEPSYTAAKNTRQEIFALKAASDIGQLHFITLWAVNEGDATNLNLLRTTANDLERLRSIVSRLLGNRTLGLLEIDSLGYVAYLHRTVSEWASKTFHQTLHQNQATFGPELDIIRGLCTLGHLVPMKSIVARPTRWPEYYIGTVMCHVSKLAARPESDVESTRNIVSWLIQLQQNLPSAAREVTCLQWRQSPGYHEVKAGDFCCMLACVGYEPFFRFHLMKNDVSWQNGMLYHVCLHGNNYRVINMNYKVGVPLKVRLRLVRLCLENGATPSRTMLGVVETCTFEAAADDVRRIAVESHGASNGTDEIYEYFEKVAETLDAMAAAAKSTSPIRYKSFLKRTWAKVKRSGN